MKLAFSGQGRYPDYSDGYALYKKRVRKQPLNEKKYVSIVRSYCRSLAERLIKEGLVELPNGMGMISAAMIKRRPQYRGENFIGYGKMDYDTGTLDGTLNAFGMVFLPKHGTNDNLRCFGYVANRKLFKRMKALFTEQECDWRPLNFNEDMI